MIRADVNAAANCAEALHNVTAAAAIARVCWGPSGGRSCRDPFPAAREGRLVFVLSVCLGRGSLTPEPKPRGGQSLLRPQPVKPVVAFQASESGSSWAWWRVRISPGGQIRRVGSLP